MALTYDEAIESTNILRDVQTGHVTAERKFVVRGTIDGRLAADFVRASEPNTYPGLLWPLKTVRGDVDPDSVDHCIVTMAYELVPNAPPGGDGIPEHSFRFDSGAQSEHLTFAMRQWQNNYGTGAAHNRIGQELEGADVYRPTFTYEQQHLWDGVTAAYLSTLYAMTATVNRLAWKIWPRRSLLFMGATGEEQRNGQVNVIYRFLYRPPTPLYTEGSVLYGYAYGWDFTWNTWYEIVNAEDRRERRQLDNMIAQVYEETDFANLGIGA